MENNEFYATMEERFSKDSLISIATINAKNIPSVRTVDALYIDGSFYSITYQTSNKMKQIGNSDLVGICGEWFQGHAKGSDLGYIKLDSNSEIFNKLKDAFSSWYSNGHINEADEKNIILKLEVVDGVIFKDGKMYKLNK